MADYQKIHDALEMADYSSAARELVESMQKGSWDDTLAIYAATLAWEAGDEELAYNYISQGLA